jgi:tetratricopeptide (TPR) repeat protein
MPAGQAGDPDGYHANIADTQGVQVGSGIQINLFGGRDKPRGPVVAGKVPQVPPAFQSRADLLARLRGAGPGVSVVRAVTGMRGVGKTQLAAAYARECRDAGWRLVAWVNAEDTTATLSGMAVVADRLGIDKSGRTLEDVSLEVRNRLEADGEECLIVFDNVTDPEAVRPYVPSLGSPQVLITSTEHAAVALGKPVQVAVFTEEEAVAFLADRTGRADVDGARALAGELGYLPLALSQASAVMVARHLAYDVYLRRLRAYPAQRFLPEAKGEPYPRGTAEAILLSIDTLKSADQAGLCLRLLSIVSVLSPDGVPRDLLYTGEPAETSAERADAVDEALSRLAEASLLTFSGDDSSPTVIAHRLVMRVVRERAAHDGTLTSVGAEACELLALAAEPLGEPWKHRPAARELVRQVIALTDHLAPQASADRQLAEALLARRGWALSCLNELADSASQASAIGGPLVADFVRMLGDSHPDTLEARNGLATAYRAAGQIAEALALHERTLADRIRVLGADHPDTLASRNNVAKAYEAAGRTAEAIPLYERTLADRVRVLGEDHEDTLMSRNNLAAAYHSIRQVEQAVALYERTLADRARLLGEDHPETLRSLSNLAYAYHTAGRREQSVALYERALAGRVRLLGEEHPDTLRSRNGLAFAYRAAGRLAEAVELYERTLADRVRVLGDAHPETLRSRNNLAYAYRASGRSQEAVALYERTLADRIRLLGEDHPDTSRSRNNLAAAYRAAGRLAEAVSLYEQALPRLERVLGPEHPTTAKVRANLIDARQRAQGPAG